MSVKRVLAAALLCGAGPFPALGAHEWGGSFVLTSDYVFRGQSQSQGDPALQADLHWHGATNWFAGVWASMVHLHVGPGPTSELNAYAGRGWRLDDDWHAKLVAVSYIYPKDSRELHWDYDEVAASLAFRDAVIASIAWSPNTSRFSRSGIAENREAIAYELTAHLPWRTAWTVTGGVGYYDLGQLFGSGYTYWSCGVTYAAMPWQFMLTRFGTSRKATALFGADTTADRWSLGARWQFRGARP